MRNTIILTSLIILVLKSVSVYAQHTTQTVFQVKDEKRINENISDSLQIKYSSNSTEIMLLKEKVEFIFSILNLLIGVIIAILAIGGITSFVNIYISERRARETHDLAIKGEISSQNRAEIVHQTFLVGSKTTLDLVNSTLRLAQEASITATKIIEKKAQSTLERLNKEARELIAIGPKKLVSEPSRRSELHMLAHKIAGFEINLFILPPEIRLTPDCLFIKGMASHLNQQFQEALESWKEVVNDDATKNDLKSLALYWIGLEFNNLGKFSDACNFFERALEITTGSQWYELNRILIESRFFNKNEEKEDDLIPPLEKLLSLIEKETGGKEFISIKTKIYTTLGSIYLQYGNRLRKQNLKNKAKQQYKLAKMQFEKVYNEDKWAMFNLAETYYQSGELEKAEVLFLKIRPLAIDEYICKEEPRIKVQAHATELICCMRIPNLVHEVNVLNSQVLDVLGRVDEQLTIYSPMQNRNVSKDEFKKNLAELMSEVTANLK